MDFGLKPDRVLVSLDVAPKFPSSLLGIELRVVLYLFGELVIALDWRVVLEHV